MTRIAMGTCEQELDSSRDTTRCRGEMRVVGLITVPGQISPPLAARPSNGLPRSSFEIRFTTGSSSFTSGGTEWAPPT